MSEKISKDYICGFCDACHEIFLRALKEGHGNTMYFINELEKSKLEEFYKQTNSDIEVK